MARTVTEIFDSIVEAKNADPVASKINSRSKFAIWKSWADVTSQVIFSFETIMDLFKSDLDAEIVTQDHGVPAWYVKMLLEYQDGDELIFTDVDKVKTGYAVIDEAKRVITRGAYNERDDTTTGDIVLDLKVATGEAGSYQPLTIDQKGRVSAYLNMKRYAGTKYTLISKKGDFLVPTMTVYHDGLRTSDDIQTSVKNILYEYMKGLDFDSVVYQSEIFNAVRDLDNVEDVVVDKMELAPFNDLEELQPLYEMGRKEIAIAGYINESDGTTFIHGTSTLVPTFDECITIVAES